jgi:hypothetical protein
MDVIKKIWDYLIECSEELYEYRKANLRGWY